MVCAGTRSPSSSMWAVVVLGIITAVFAWVWFGGRGSERSETQEDEQDTHVTAETIAETDPQDSEREERSVTFQKHSPSADNGAGSTPGETNQRGEDDEVYGQDDHLSNKSYKVEENDTFVQPKLSAPTEPKLTTSIEPKLSVSTKPKLTASSEPKLSASNEPKLATSTEPTLSTSTEPKLSTSTEPQLTMSTEPQLTAPTEPKLPALTGPKLPAPTEAKLATSTVADLAASPDPKLISSTDPKLPTATDTKLTILMDPKPVTSTDSKQVHPPESKPLPVEDIQSSEEDLYHFTVPEKEVVQISPDILKATAKEDFIKTQVEVNHATGSEEQGLQVKDVSTSHKELVDSKDEVEKVIVEDLKTSATKEEKLTQTKEETSNITVPENVVAITTHLTHLDGIQDDGVKLVNGSEEHVQRKIETVNPDENVASDTALNVTASPKQVHLSSSKNAFDQYNHNKQDYAVKEKPSAALESAADIQVNGHIVQTNNLLSEESIPTNLEDVLLTSPAVDKCDGLLHSSILEEESQRETKLHDLDLHRTKRVAAVQPIPQNVSLDFKVHYITQSDSQMVAITGDHEKLGEWENYVPLNSDKDGYWSHSITLPADANVEWKFVMVENGKIKRWEECNNRHIRTAHEDIASQQWWGYP